MSSYASSHEAFDSMLLTSFVPPPNFGAADVNPSHDLAIQLHSRHAGNVANSADPLPEWI